MLQAVIFDLDGVILDSHPAHMRAWQELFRELGTKITDDDLQFVLEGYSREEILRHYLGDLPSAELKNYGARKEQLFRKWAGEVKTVPGLTEFLDQLDAASIPYAVATSAAGARTTYMLEGLGLMHRFRAIVTGDDATRPKPDPEIFELATRKLRRDAKKVLVCEDSVAGVTAAKAAGMKCVAIGGNERRSVLKQAGADAVVVDFTGVDLASLGALCA